MRAGDEDALKAIFQTYYADLCRSAYRVLTDQVMAEDLVQEVFYELWRKREQLHVQHALGAYLRRAVVNRTLNYLRDQRLPVADESQLPTQLAHPQAGVAQQLEAEELRVHLHEAIDQLPERCRQVFVLSRFEDLTNKEIADQLAISVKTVENQMTKALRLLRAAIDPYLGLWISGWGWLIWELLAN
ncbi:MAG: RNA polymerase sigma-70 factor [Lewinella sp.]|nr:RNA polymerase sigma-70 factor [Lewinella sp.]